MDYSNFWDNVLGQEKWNEELCRWEDQQQARIEEEYFNTIAQCLASVGFPHPSIEKRVHEIMDTWTFDGVLDTEALDAIIGQWNLTENGVTLPSN